MNSEYKLTLSPESLQNSGRTANMQGDRNANVHVAPACGETHTHDIRSRTGSPKDAGRDYRFERLTLPIVLKDLRFSKNDPGPGDRVPEFDLPIVGGGRFRARELSETGPALLVFGSSTCPVTDNAAPGLNELYDRFGNQVRFVMVNVREAHPGKAFPQPTTLNAKTAHAEQLRILHGFKFELAVDDVDGTLHRALGPKPNSAYILGADGKFASAHSGPMTRRP